MNTQHTPGPWWLDDDGFVAAGSGDRYKTVADPRCMDPAGNEAETEANARLIAAAPDLLAVAIQLDECCGIASRLYGDKMPATAGIITAWKMARAAIAKAKGGQQ